MRELEAATSVGVFEMIDRSDAPTLARARSGVRPPPISAHEFESFFSLDGAPPFPPLQEAHLMVEYFNSYTSSCLWDVQTPSIRSPEDLAAMTRASSKFDKPQQTEILVVSATRQWLECQDTKSMLIYRQMITFCITYGLNLIRNGCCAGKLDDKAFRKRVYESGIEPVCPNSDLKFVSEPPQTLCLAILLVGSM